MPRSSASVRFAALCVAILFVGCSPRGSDGPASVAPAGEAAGPVAGMGAGGAPSSGGSVDPSVVPAAPTSGSRCAVDAVSGDITCTYQGVSVDGRPVLWQTPLGAAPAAGWPVVLVFQGSFFAPEQMWAAAKNDLLGIFGTYTQTLTIKRLLDGGYVVVTPTADLSATAWDTNLIPWRDLWSPAPDNQFLEALFAAIDGGAFGPVDPARWYATGVSSGGYMTSRMAVSYAGRFRALAVAAGSYATCGGPLCTVPLILPSSHPPTLFLHGGADPVVPIATMYAYRNILAIMGRPTRVVVEPAFLHGWIPQTPDEVLAWFDTH